MSSLPATRLPQYAMETANRERERISAHVRLKSPAMTLACRQAGMPMELAEMCGGLLASVVDDLDAVSRLPKQAFERSKRMERILAVTAEPTLSALRLAMAASPVNGRACVRHWDMVCEQAEVGKLAWLLNMQTETAWKYAKRMEKRQ